MDGPAPARARTPALIDEAAVERALHEVYVPVATTRLRREEAQKVRELAPLLAEIDGLLRRLAASRELVLVDAAAGRGYVSLLSSRLLLAPAARAFRWVVIEREERRAAACASLAARDGLGERFEVRCGDVADPALWPAAPDLVVALHACGPAADAVIARAAAARARALLLVPCCVSKAVGGHARAHEAAQALGVARQAPVRRRFLEALIASGRTLALEAQGYLVEVVEFCPPSVTPHNLAWRCRWLGDLTRMRRAAEALERLQAQAPPP